MACRLSSGGTNKTSQETTAFTKPFKMDICNKNAISVWFTIHMFPSNKWSARTSVCLSYISQYICKRLENWETVIQLATGLRHFLLSKASTPVPLSIQTLVQWVLLALSSEVKQPWCEPHHPPHILSRLGMSGIIPTLPHMPLGSAHEKVCLYA